MTVKGKRPGETAQTLGVTTATLRNYVVKFGKFLSPNANLRNRKRFSEDDIKVLLYVRSLLDDGLTYDQVTQELESRPLTGEILEDWQPPEPEPEQDYTEPEPSRQLMTLEYIQMIVSQTEATIAAKDETIEELRRDKERLQKELDQLRKPWYKRLFGE